MAEITAAVALVAASALAAGSAVRQRDEVWYRCVRAPWTPPNAVFPIVWTVAYAILATALTVTIRTDGFVSLSASLQVANLVLGVWWCVEFFVRRHVERAAIVLVAVTAVSAWAAAASSSPLSRKSLSLYTGWCLFALSLSFGAMTRASEC
jgi:tryptophan-rich sensory protein